MFVGIGETTFKHRFIWMDFVLGEYRICWSKSEETMNVEKHILLSDVAKCTVSLRLI